MTLNSFLEYFQELYKNTYINFKCQSIFTLNLKTIKVYERWVNLVVKASTRIRKIPDSSLIQIGEGFFVICNNK